MPGPWPGSFLIGSAPSSPPTDEEGGKFITAGLGTFSFPFKPQVNTIRKVKEVVSMDTYSSNQAKDFGFQPDEFGVVGNEYELTWEIMSETFFNSLKSYYESTETLIWDPEERARIPGETYYVTARDLSHDHDHRTTTYLVNVRLVLNIRGVV